MTSNCVVIIAPEDDPHGQAVRDRLRAGGCDVHVIDTQRFPAEMRISLGAALDHILIDGEPLRPSAVYVRNYGLSTIRSEDLGGEQGRRATIALRERSDVIMSIVHRWEALGVRFYNPPSARERITKPYQLALLAAAGLPVPATRWTNDPEEVLRFGEGRRIAYKPVAGGAATRELTERDLTRERLARLASAPVCFQELLPGQDIRVYVVDGEVVACIRIDTDEIDFRQNETAIVPYPLDETLRDICLRATAALGLRFTGMDLKGDVNGQLKILELNPSPMFLGFDEHSGSDILGALCAALRRA